jgi:hypothetical protein
MARASSSVRSGRRAYFAQSKRPNPEGHLVAWKVFAPSWDRSRFTLMRRPSMRAIMVMTVVTPMTMPSSVSSERSGLPRNVPKANRRLSKKALMGLPAHS